MAPEPCLQTSGLTKSYGKQVGIAGLDVEVRAGEVFGLLGPNGAGKTTTIRLVLGLLRPTSGTATLFGNLDSQRDGVRARRRIGYLPGDLALYDDLTGRACLEFFARMRGGVDRRVVDDLAERLNLDLGRRIRDLSKGNRQKLGVVQAFMHEPELLILDEPTSGLDPVVQREFQTIVDETTARGAAILLSSHVLAEVEHLAHRVGIVVDGRLVVVDDIDALKQHAVRRLDLDFGRAVDPASFERIEGVTEVTARGDVLDCTVTGHVTGLLRAAVDAGVLNVVSHEPDLEDIFLGYVRGGGNDARGAGHEDVA